MKKILLFLVLTGGLSACGGKTSVQDPDTETQILSCAAHQNDDPCAVCEQLATAICDMFSQCSPGAFRWADMESCIAVQKSKCRSSLNITGTSETVGGKWLDSQLYAEYAKCGTPVFPQVDETCASEGKLEAGTSCFETYQCKKGFGCKSNGAGSLTCSAFVGEGGKCVPGDCDAPVGFTCISGICKKPGLEGEACVKKSDCESFYCLAGKCTSKKHFGESCTATIECEAALTCNNKLCGSPVFPKEGENCDISTGCAFGLTCRKGTCATVALGDECGDENGIPAHFMCGPGLSCVWGSGTGKALCTKTIPVGGDCGTPDNYSNCDYQLDCVDNKCGGANAPICK